MAAIVEGRLTPGWPKEESHGPKNSHCAEQDAQMHDDPVLDDGDTLRMLYKLGEEPHVAGTSRQLQAIAGSGSK